MSGNFRTGSSGTRDSTQRYRVLRELGRGGMGSVWLVHDAERDQPVALKRITGTSTSAQLRFKREFRVVEQLLHPGLVRLYDLSVMIAGSVFGAGP